MFQRREIATAEEAVGSNNHDTHMRRGPFVQDHDETGHMCICKSKLRNASWGLVHFEWLPIFDKGFRLCPDPVPYKYIAQSRIPA